MRGKLVSEVKTNRDKAKKTSSECINKVFALTCEETSLATLKIYFPPVKIWRVNHLKTEHNQYIDVYLDIIYLPVIEATKDLEILSLALKIIGEALLEHIYAKRIKFTICGAINLMKDFDGIAAWIETCRELPGNYREKLSRHEVLKVCEGVGKVSSHNPQLMKNYKLFSSPLFPLFHYQRFFISCRFLLSARISLHQKILLRQPDEIILLHNNPQKPKGEKGSATDDGKFIKHFIGIVCAIKALVITISLLSLHLFFNFFASVLFFAFFFTRNYPQMMNAPTFRPKCTSINRNGWSYVRPENP